MPSPCRVGTLLGSLPGRLLGPWLRILGSELGPVLSRKQLRDDSEAAIVIVLLEGRILLLFINHNFQTIHKTRPHTELPGRVNRLHLARHGQTDNQLLTFVSRHQSHLINRPVVRWDAVAGHAETAADLSITSQNMGAS